MKDDPVITAAIKWWENRRPCAWDQATHLKNPTVNTMTAAEKGLALAVAEHIRKSA